MAYRPLGGHDLNDSWDNNKSEGEFNLKASSDPLSHPAVRASNSITIVMT